MYAKILVVAVALVTLVILEVAAAPAPHYVVFNFREKLLQATTTTTEETDRSQMIRVPEFRCLNGYRRDGAGLCRQRF